MYRSHRLLIALRFQRFCFSGKREPGSTMEFLFVPFRTISIRLLVSGFHTSRNLCARTGDRFSFSVARDQMLVTWGDRAPLEHSLDFIPLLTTKKNTKNTEKSTEFWGSWYSTWTSWNFTQASILTVFQESRIENWGSRINFWGPVNLLLSGTVHLIDHRQEPLKMHALLRVFYK